MHLDDLGRLEVRSGDLGQVHHQHRADREVRRRNPAQLLGFARGLEFVDVGRGKAGGSDDRRSTSGDGRKHVVHRVRGSGEIDERARPLLVEKRSQVIPSRNSADVVDVRVGLKSGGED